jgi:adenylosuccinate synthase
VRICVAYERRGERITEFPGDAFVLEECKPVYETHAGWSTDISGVRKLADMPSAARKYVDRIADLIGKPASVVSVGPDREQTILVK